MVEADLFFQQGFDKWKGFLALCRMETRGIFLNLSPLDHRYYQSNRQLFDKLSAYLSEAANVRYCARVEIALLLTHLKLQNLETPELVQAVRRAEDLIDPEAVYEEEEKTQHNIRALVNVLKPLLPESVRHFVHMGATSVDILDTANALKIRDAVQEVLLPQLVGLELQLAELAEREADTPQVGRTHGQFAVPISFGFAMAEYVSRLGKSILEIDTRSRDLRGKLAGAVGAYNATSMLTSDPETMERLSLSFLGLEPSDHSTQLVEPEYLLRLLVEINVAFGIIANLADDLRNLQRSEIDEIREHFSSTQVGSSTMPQKRNPWNSEHVKSLWKAFAPRVQSFFMDQISEHQRDLTNSASSRFTADYLAGFAAAVARMQKILDGLSVNRAQLLENLEQRAGSSVLAEAAYILLGRNGESDAHEMVRLLTLESEKSGRTLKDVMQERPEIWQRIVDGLRETTGQDAEAFFSSPAMYRGKASEKARALAAQWRDEMNIVSSRLKNEQDKKGA